MSYQSKAEIAGVICRRAAEVHDEDLEEDSVRGAFIHLRCLGADTPGSTTHAIDAHAAICQQMTRDIQDIGQVAPGFSELAALLYGFLEPQFRYEEGVWTKGPDIFTSVIPA